VASIAGFWNKGQNNRQLSLAGKWPAGTVAILFFCNYPMFTFAFVIRMMRQPAEKLTFRWSVNLQ